MDSYEDKPGTDTYHPRPPPVSWPVGRPVSTGRGWASVLRWMSMRSGSPPDIVVDIPRAWWTWKCHSFELHLIDATCVSDWKPTFSMLVTVEEMSLHLKAMGRGARDLAASSQRHWYEKGHSLTTSTRHSSICNFLCRCGSVHHCRLHLAADSINYTTQPWEEMILPQVPRTFLKTWSSMLPSIAAYTNLSVKILSPQ
jgi:hypothetical protein